MPPNVFAIHVSFLMTGPLSLTGGAMCLETGQERGELVVSSGQGGLGSGSPEWTKQLLHLDVCDPLSNAFA